jgi:hypothetical protein
MLDGFGGQEMNEWTERLKIPPSRLDGINRILADSGTTVIKEFSC